VKYTAIRYKQCGALINILIVIFQIKPMEEKDSAKLNNGETKLDVERTPGSVDSLDTGLIWDKLPISHVLFQTTYTNRSGREQEYTMSVRRTSKVTLTTDVTSTHSNGVNMSVTLQTPAELLQASVGYQSQYTLTRSSQQAFEGELDWGVDSLIKVCESRFGYKLGFSPVFTLSNDGAFS
jgi:hypothetical protein